LQNIFSFTRSNNPWKGFFQAILNFWQRFVSSYFAWFWHFFWVYLSCSVKFGRLHFVYIIFLWYFVKKYQLWTEFFQYPSGYWACDFQYPNLKSGIAGISGYRYHKFEALTGLIFVNKCFSLTWSWVQQQLQHSTAEWRRKRSVVLYVAKMKREGQMLLPLKISLWFFCRTSYHNQLEMV
jgi:hypothetical protein